MACVHAAMLSQSDEVDNEQSTVPAMSAASESTLQILELSSDNACLKKSIELLKKENEMLERELKNQKLCRLKYDEEWFKDNDERVLFYTGLTNWPLLTLYNFTESAISLQHHISFTPFQQLILTSMRLRLSLCGQDLADRFGIHSATVSRIFRDVLYLLYECLKFLIVWPEREAIRKTLPVAFREECPTCTCIINCFEVFIEKPSDRLASCKTYSNQ